MQFLSGSVEESMKHLPFMGGELPAELNRLKGSMRRLAVPKVGAVFEELGFTYMGPIDGHDMAEMTRTFQAAHRVGGPVLVHVITTKGKGYPYAEADQVGYHAQSAFDLSTGKARPSKTPKPPSYSKVFGQTLVKLCEQNGRVVGITAAMATGTGLDLLQKAIPEQYIDVGILNSMPSPSLPAWPAKDSGLWWRSTARSFKGPTTSSFTMWAFRSSPSRLCSIALASSVLMGQPIRVNTTSVTSGPFPTSQ